MRTEERTARETPSDTRASRSAVTYIAALEMEKQIAEKSSAPAAPKP